MMTNSRRIVSLRSLGRVALACLVLSTRASADFVPFGADSLSYMKSNSAIVVSTSTAETIEATDDHVVIEVKVDKTLVGEPRRAVRLVVLKSGATSQVVPERFTMALVFLKAPLNEKSLEHYKILHREQPVSLLTSRSAVIQPVKPEQWATLIAYLSLQNVEARLNWAEVAASSLDVEIQKWGLQEVSAHLATAPESARQLLVDLTDNKLPRLSPGNQKILVQQLVALKDFGVQADHKLAEETANSKLVGILAEEKLPFAVRTSAFQGITESKRPDLLYEWANANPTKSAVANALSEFEKASAPERLKLTKQWRLWGDPSLRAWSHALMCDSNPGVTIITPDMSNIPIADLRQLLTSTSRKDHLVLADKVSAIANQDGVLTFVQEAVSGKAPAPNYLRERLVDSIASRYSQPTIDFLKATATNDQIPSAIRTSALTGIGRHAKQHPYANQTLLDLSSKLPEGPLRTLTVSMILKD